MSKKQQKYYVVWKGHKPGIYNTWEEAKYQINGFENALHKSFLSKDEAETAFRSKPEKIIYNNTKNQPLSSNTKIPKPSKVVLENSICVDAACSGNPGDVEYRGVVTTTGKEIFRQGPFKMGTNNLGEFLALVHALALLDKSKKYDVTIFSDSLTAISWVRKRQVKTKLERTSANEEIYNLIERAYQWLMTHEVKNPIVKWETESWGEIPADFGRK